MTLFNISIGIAVAVIVLIVYSALVVSSQQERTARRVREENRFERAPYSIYSFETSEELTPFDDEHDVFNDF